ncbi:hypothetical protein KP509_22G048000 [Ceratopteris richardii]|uniref:Uncharacterized protein n=1 Tax=Ceratopteris richardii TaxID=49495 RepID=A0A8T2S4R0_CERRI|nr:hypothetical protein KP509_22G048000 [Ceratopteris richardii]
MRQTSATISSKPNSESDRLAYTDARSTQRKASPIMPLPSTAMFIPSSLLHTKRKSQYIILLVHINRTKSLTDLISCIEEPSPCCASTYATLVAENVVPVGSSPLMGYFVSILIDKLSPKKKRKGSEAHGAPNFNP